MDTDKIRQELKMYIVGDTRPLEWFAKQIGIHRVTLADFFYKRRNATSKTIMKIEDYLAKKKTKRRMHGPIPHIYYERPTKDSLTFELDGRLRRFEVGDRWIDTENQRSYILESINSNEAVWEDKSHILESIESNEAVWEDIRDYLAKKEE